MSMIPGFRLHRSLFSLATYPDWTLKQATMEAHITQNTLIWLVLSMVCNWKVQPPGGNGIHVQSDQWTNRQQMNLEASWQGDITQIATHRIAPQFSWLPSWISVSQSSLQWIFEITLMTRQKMSQFWQTPISLRVCLKRWNPNSHDKPPFPLWYL